jgi:hypothetical protein
MNAVYKNSGGVPRQYLSPKEKRLINSMVYPCNICKAITAMLIFAVDAETGARLEDYARMMHSKIKWLYVPTWIVGKETENIVNGIDLRKSHVLKVHPEREEVRIITPYDLMGTIDKLMEMHCKN